MPRADLEPGACPRCQQHVAEVPFQREEDELACEPCGTRWTYAAPTGSLPTIQQDSIRSALNRMRRKGFEPSVIYIDKSLAAQLAFMEGTARTCFEIPFAETYVRGLFNAVVEVIERRLPFRPELGSRWKHVTDATMFGIVHEVAAATVESLGHVTLLRARDSLRIPIQTFSSLFIPDAAPRIESVAIGSSWNVGGIVVRVVTADENDVTAVTTNGSRITLPLMSFINTAKMIAEVPVAPPPWSEAADRFKTLSTYARQYPLTGRWQTAFSLSVVTVMSSTATTVTVEGIFEDRGFSTHTFPIEEFRRRYQKIPSTPAPTNGAFVRHLDGGALLVVRGMEPITELVCLETSDRQHRKITVERFSVEYRFVEADAYDLTAEGFEII